MNERAEERGPSNPSSVIGLNHIGLSVSDLEASLAFYSEGTSVEVDRSKRLGNPAAEEASGFDNRPVDRAVLAGPNGYLELSQYESSLAGPAGEIPVRGPGITHVCYQAPTPKDIYGRLRQLGATPVSRGTEPVDLGGYGVYYAYARDADGIMFETEHLDEPHFDGPLWLSHVALVTPDIDRLVAFYERVLGFEPNRRSDNIAGPKFDEVANYDRTRLRAAWFQTTNMILELWQFVNPVTPEAGAPLPFEKIGYNKFAFETSDLRSDYERLAQSGVQLLSQPVQSEASTEVFGRDPDGNLFSLIQPAPDSGISIETLKAR